MRKTIGFTLLVVAAALVLSGCSRHNPLSPDTRAIGPAASSLAGKVIDGPYHFESRTGPASLYSIDVPRGWNGDLVLYAHGIAIPPDLPIALPQNPAIPLLLEQGYAVALSSWDENGYAVKDAVERTHQLEGLFASKVRKPDRTYLMGASIGGLVVLTMAEKWPDRYAGALTESGVMGGTLRELDYIATARVLFDCLYPGALPGSLYESPNHNLDIQTQIAPMVVGAIQQHPERLPILIALLEGRLPGKDGNEYVTSLVYTAGFQIRGANDLIDRTRNHSFFHNMDKLYTSPYVPQPVLDDVNQRVARYEGAPDAINYLLHYYEPTGELHIPMLSIHNERDPVVPAWNETRYATLVANAGHSDMLLQRIKPDTYGHTNFTAAEFAGAFHDLATWVETGVKPAN